MEKSTENINKELSALEYNIRSIMAGYTKDEILDSKQQIERMSSRIEEVLRHYRTVPGNVISSTVQRVNDEMYNLVGREITHNRLREADEIRVNLSGVGTALSYQTRDRPHEFKQEGIFSQDNRFCLNVEEVCSRLVGAYRKALENVNERRADEVLYEVRSVVSKTSSSLQQSHKDYSFQIRKDINKKIEELGMTLDSRLEQTIEQEIQKEAPKQPENDFAKALQAKIASDEELIKYDEYGVSENEKAFREKPKISEEQKKANREAFK